MSYGASLREELIKVYFAWNPHQPGNFPLLMIVQIDEGEWKTEAGKKLQFITQINSYYSSISSQGRDDLCLNF